jgi:hypothetical protein
MYLRGIDPSQCDKSFMWNVVSPIYAPRDEEVRSMAWVASIALWIISVGRLLRKPEMVTEFFVVARKAFAEDTYKVQPVLTTM